MPPAPPIDEAPPPAPEGADIVVTSCFPADSCILPLPIIENAWLFPLIGIGLAAMWLALCVLRRPRRARS